MNNTYKIGAVALLAVGMAACQPAEQTDVDAVQTEEGTVYEVETPEAPEAPTDEVNEDA